MTTPTRIDRVTILLVDASPAKLSEYKGILGELGDTLITASTAAEALEHLVTTDVAVVLVDVRLPELDGFELAGLIRQHPRGHETAIIFVSALTLSDDDRLRGYDSGAVDFVPVPVEPGILLAKVRLFADLHRKTRALEKLNGELEHRVRERTAALEATTDALRDADRRKDEFLAMLAHELRNPLAPIRTAVQLLRLAELPERQRASVRDIIERQVEHLVKLIDDLLDVSRITRGVIQLQRQPELVAAVVARAVETVRPLFDTHRHELVLDMPDELLTVNGDKTRLVQMVANVLHNAAKFTEPMGRIILRVERDGPEVVLSVTDTGPGIAAEVLPHIFDLFNQGQERAGSPAGLGIGLALVKRLSEMHGGSASAHSDGPGTGTCVTLRLPLLRSDATAAEPRPLAGPAAAAPRRILIADDNHDAAVALGLQLRMAGHDVRTVHDGAAALTEAATFLPEIALLDLGMPKVDGYEAASRIRATPWGAGIRLVALTGWGQPQDRVRSASAGFDVHLVKPVSEGDLFKALDGQSDAGHAGAHDAPSFVR